MDVVRLRCSASGAVEPLRERVGYDEIAAPSPAAMGPAARPTVEQVWS